MNNDRFNGKTRIMIYFNYEKLNGLLTDLSILIRAKVSIFDSNFQDTKAYGNTDNQFCKLIKHHIPGACLKSDTAAINRCAYELSINYHCHFGFIEMMFKKMINDTPIYVCIGPFRDPKTKDKDIKRIKEFCELTHCDYKEMINYYNEMPLYSDEKYASIKSLTNAIFEHAKETKIIAIKEDFFESDIDPFLKANYGKNYSIQELCDIFAVPQKKFHSVVKKSTGLSPKQYITKIKIDKAFEEIILTTKDLQVISSDVGIDDYNYFIKVFKSLRGHTPKYFRQESEEKDEK